MKYGIVLTGIILLAAGVCASFYFNSLTFKVQKAVFGMPCTVRAAVIHNDYLWSFNDEKAPLMSVFKYFVGVSVLNKIDREKLSLDDEITVTEDMIIRSTWSPMLKKYTKTPFKISVSDLMKYMVSESDNNATDILINYIGGISVLNSDLAGYSFNNVKILADEKMMEADIQNQYLNKARALDVALAIKFIREGNLLSDKSKAFLHKIMIETVTGENKLKAGLPKGTVFGHKTGMSSRKPDGIRIAENDAGFVILPDGSTYYIAVFVTESKMSDAENAAVIAKISEITYKHFNGK